MSSLPRGKNRKNPMTTNSESHRKLWHRTQAKPYLLIRTHSFKTLPWNEKEALSSNHCFMAASSRSVSSTSRPHWCGPAGSSHSRYIADHAILNAIKSHSRYRRSRSWLWKWGGNTIIENAPSNNPSVKSVTDWKGAGIWILYT